MILDPILISSPSIKINIQLSHGECFDYRFIRYKNIERKERWDFRDYTAKLIIYDQSPVRNVYYEVSSEDRRGLALYDGEIRVYISSQIIDTFNFDRAEYALILIDNCHRKETYIKGLVFLDLGVAKYDSWNGDSSTN